jgi:Fanconi anemia group M protein
MEILREELIEKREYQLAIAETASEKNTLVVLPTGMGKTLIGLFVAAKRIQKFPESKIIIMAPTRPLSAQHKKTFEKFTNLNSEEIVLVTGKIRPEERNKLYEKGKVIIATPQTIKNDLENNRLNFENFCFALFDEAHRAVKDYAYPYIAKKYMLQSKNPLILALTASPGGSYERIEEICKNLFIKAVEIRTEFDKDVKTYVKPIKIEWVYVELPEEFKKAKELIEKVLKEDLNWLAEHNFLTKKRVTRKELLTLHQKISAQYVEGQKNYSFIWAMIKTAEAIKLEHALELLETQGVPFVYEYFEKMMKSRKRVDMQIVRRPEIKEAFKIIEKLNREKISHPKLQKLLYIIKDLLKDPKIKIIVFANYRSTVDTIKELLQKEGINAEILIGQAKKGGKGMSQEEQINTIKNFSEGKFNILVGTSISEEGLDIPFADYAIFYEAVPSEIRVVQRRGRVGRQKIGKVIFLLTKGTRDEAYYWAAFQKEKKMKGILYDMKERKRLEKPKSLLDWLK